MEIKRFLESINYFSAIHTDTENAHENETVNKKIVNTIEENENIDNNAKFKKSIANHKVVHIKNNYIPRGLVTLAFFFYKNDTVFRPTLQPK
jgi:hypothetical protein